jgi:hypothetical protein
VDIEMKLKVANVQIVDWQFQGEWCEDHYKVVTSYMVLAELKVPYRGEDGEEPFAIRALVHDIGFPDDLEGAKRLAARVEKAGVIDNKYWFFHEFFSRTLEQRLNEEAYHEDMHRKGHGHLSKGVFSTGHE